MKISSINRDNVSFERMPNAQEMRVYSKSINEGLNLLNKRVDIIIHNSAAPAIEAENTGIGSLFSRTVQEKLIPFLKAHGFTNTRGDNTIDTKSAKAATMVSPSGFRIVVVEHIKK